MTSNTAEKISAARWSMLAMLCLVQLMLMISDTTVNIALPSIQRELGVPASMLAWIVNGYVLAFGGLLVVAGRIGDRFGLVKAFSAGIVLFGLGSAACGLASSGEQLVAFRFLQGVGAAVVAPTVLGLLTVIFTERSERNRAFSIWGATATLGGVTGVVISGLLTDLLSWRAVFYVNLPVVLLVLMVQPRLAKPFQRSHPGTRIDLTAAVLLILTVGGLVYTLQSAAAHGLESLQVLLAMLIAVLAAAGFAVVQRIPARRLVPAGLLSDRGRASALAAGMLNVGGVFVVFFVLTLLMQGKLGYTPLQTGFAYVPFGAAAVTGIWLAGRLLPQLGSRLVVGISLVIGVIGALILAVLPTDVTYWALLPGIVLFGGGTSAALPSLAQLAIAGTPPADAGVAGGIVNSSQQLGGAVGLALGTAMLGAQGVEYRSALIASLGLTAAAVLAALLLPRAAAQSERKDQKEQESAT